MRDRAAVNISAGVYAFAVPPATSRGATLGKPRCDDDLCGPILLLFSHFTEKIPPFCWLMTELSHPASEATQGRVFVVT